MSVCNDINSCWWFWSFVHLSFSCLHVCFLPLTSNKWTVLCFLIMFSSAFTRWTERNEVSRDLTSEGETLWSGLVWNNTSAVAFCSSVYTSFLFLSIQQAEHEQYFKHWVCSVTWSYSGLNIWVEGGERTNRLMHELTVHFKLPWCPQTQISGNVTTLAAKVLKLCLCQKYWNVSLTKFSLLAILLLRKPWRGVEIAVCKKMCIPRPQWRINKDSVNCYEFFKEAEK